MLQLHLAGLKDNDLEKMPSWGWVLEGDAALLLLVAIALSCFLNPNSKTDCVKQNQDHMAVELNAWERKGKVVDDSVQQQQHLDIKSIRINTALNEHQELSKADSQLGSSASLSPSAPSWTIVFLTAAFLCFEVGGMENGFGAFQYTYLKHTQHQSAAVATTINTAFWGAYTISRYQLYQ